jgi:FixJ family two-component response regulator
MNAATQQPGPDTGGTWDKGAASNSPAVFIVDDDSAVRDAIRCLVESVGLRCRLFSSGLEFLNACGTSPFGCLVLDVRMAGISGLDLQDELRARAIDLPTIIISGHGDILMAVQAMKNGALDFLEKPFRNQVLLDSINRALEQNAKRCDEKSVLKDIEARYFQLTAREKEVFGLLIEGKATKLVARELNLSHRTVEVHRAHIMKKIGAQSVSDLVRFAYVLRGRS